MASGTAVLVEDIPNLALSMGGAPMLKTDNSDVSGIFNSWARRVCHSLNNGALRARRRAYQNNDDRTG